MSYVQTFVGWLLLTLGIGFVLVWGFGYEGMQIPLPWWLCMSIVLGFAFSIIAGVLLVVRGLEID